MGIMAWEFILQHDMEHCCFERGMRLCVTSWECVLGMRLCVAGLECACLKVSEGVCKGTHES